MRYVAWGVTALLGALALGAGTATAAPIKNGNFERGNLSGWNKSFYPSAACGRWFAHSGTYPPPGRASARGIVGGLPPAPQGRFAAVADQPECASGQILSQVVKLKPRSRHRLRFQLAYQNAFPGKPNFVTPPTLGLGVPNQQVRVDVLKAGAPVRSVQRRHVLDRVYRTETGDPDFRDYGPVKANLTPFAGRKVRLRFAVVVNFAPIRVGVDAVKIKSKRKRG